MKRLFILNPAAGKTDRTLEFSKMIEDYFKSHSGDFEIAVTKYPGHAGEIAKAAAMTGDNIRIYAFGGDGTLNEVLTGAFGFDNVELGVYPCGTGNDFIKSFPEKLDEFNNIGALINGDSIRVDIIKSGEKLGINIGNTGFDAEVVRKVAIFKKTVSGVFAYTLSILYCLLFRMSFQLKITVDNDEPVEGKYILAVGANGTTYGGGYKAAPHAAPDDGLLDIMLIKKVSRLRFLMLLNSYKKGLHTKYTDIITYKKGKRIKIESDTDISNTIDGEIFFSRNIVYEIIPKAISFILPA